MTLLDKAIWACEDSQFGHDAPMTAQDAANAMIWILTTGRDEPGELLAILHASKRKMYTLNQKMQGHTMAEQTEIWHRALKRDVEAYNRACEAR